MLAQATNDIAQLDSLLQFFRIAISAVGVGLILIGWFMFAYQPKAEEKRSRLAARMTALVSFGLIGTGTIVYAWTWFGI